MKHNLCHRLTIQSYSHHPRPVLFSNAFCLIKPEKGIDEVCDEYGEIYTLNQFSGGQQWITDAAFPNAVTMTEDFLFTTEKIEGTRCLQHIDPLKW